MDPSVIPSLEEDFPTCLNVLFDPQGLTCATGDYPGQEWEQVWASAADYFHTFDAHDRLFLGLAAEGTVFLRVQDHALTAQEESRVIESFTGILQVCGAKIAVLDGMTLFDEGIVAEEEAVALPNGKYRLTLHHLRRHPSLAKAVGLFGSDRWPTAIVTLTAVAGDESVAEGDNLVRLDTSEWVTEPAPDCLCMGTITKVFGPTVTVELHMTQHIRSGHALAALGTHKVAVGEDVVVYLERHIRNYWAARLVEA